MEADDETREAVKAGLEAGFDYADMWAIYGDVEKLPARLRPIALVRQRDAAVRGWYCEILLWQESGDAELRAYQENKACEEIAAKTGLTVAEVREILEKADATS